MTNIYTAPSLKTVPFYTVSGNHDWKGNVLAQSDGDALGDERWHGSMAFKDGTEGITQHGAGLLDVFYVETHPWATHPTAKAIEIGLMPADAVPADFWAAWEDAQIVRLETQIKNSQARWKVMAGHYGIYSYALAHWSTPSLARINTVMRQGGVHAYFNGHDHDLMAIRQPADDLNGPLYITSGAGSSCRNDIDDPVSDGSLVFGYGQSGFTNVRLTQNEMAVTFYDINGKVLGNINKPWVADPNCTDVETTDARCTTPPAPKKKLSLRTALGMARTAALDALEYIGIDAPQSREQWL